jgi:hypothetical protein
MQHTIDELILCCEMIDNIGVGLISQPKIRILPFHAMERVFVRPRGGWWRGRVGVGGHC